LYKTAKENREEPEAGLNGAKAARPKFKLSYTIEEPAIGHGSG
jgi:hypothetical protein